MNRFISIRSMLIESNTNNKFFSSRTQRCSLCCFEFTYCTRWTFLTLKIIYQGFSVVSLEFGIEHYIERKLNLNFCNFVMQ